MEIPPVAPEIVSPKPLPAAPTTPPTVFVKPPTWIADVSKWQLERDGGSITVLPRTPVTPLAALVTPESSCPKPMMRVLLF